MSSLPGSDGLLCFTPYVKICGADCAETSVFKTATNQICSKENDTTHLHTQSFLSLSFGLVFTELLEINKPAGSVMKWALCPKHAIMISLESWNLRNSSGMTRICSTRVDAAQAGNAWKDAIQFIRSAVVL